MKQFWDERYSSKEYVYGLKPNAFFKEFIDIHKPGKILLPAEGEGRNAVYAATKGWDCSAFDFSTSAREKAMQLAGKYGVTIEYQISNLEDVVFSDNEYNLCAAIFVHQKPEQRKVFHQNLIKSIKSGGYIIFEVFPKEQINRDTGGPRDVDLLYSINELKKDFQDLECLKLEQTIKNLNEGEYHKGEADIINAIFRKK